MVNFFSPPDGSNLADPDPYFLEILIRYGESLFWNSGSGQASIEFKNDEIESFITLTFDPEHGFQIEYKREGEPFYVSPVPSDT